VTALASATPVSQRRIPFWVKLVLTSVIGIAIYFAVLVTIQYLSIVNSVDPTAPKATALSISIATSAQQVGNALVLGAIYALVALGYTMVYGIIELINFAHGDVFMIGTFVSLFFLSSFPAPLDFLGLNITGVINEPLVLIAVIAAALLVGMVLMGTLNVTIERFAYRPLRHAPRVAPLITAIGVSLILQNVMQIIVGTGDRKVPQIVPNIHLDILGVQIRLISAIIFVVAILLMIGLQTFVSRTRLGRAMRATAQDQQAAQLMGVDLNLTIAMTFLIGGALAGAAGVFQGQYFGFVRFDLGFTAGLKAFTAAVLGGIGNLTGAAIGGFLIAFIEVFAQSVGQARWSQAIVFAVLILVLVFRPAGILGQQIGERA
jgi:branched-chain amino acid transport system permease protein